MALKPMAYTVEGEDSDVVFIIEDDGIAIREGWLGSAHGVREAMVALRRLALTMGWETSQETLEKVE